MNHNSRRYGAGILAVLFYAIHAGVLLFGKEPYHLIWACHLGCIFVGAGLLIPQAWLFSVGFFWLSMGVPLWIVNVLTARDFMLTSTLSHIGGICIALYGFKFIRMPKFSWMAAIAGLLVLGVISRLVTPQYANVNLSFAVWSGWEDQFPSYFRYVVMILSGTTIFFLFLEFSIRRWILRSD
jgi:hypothetical protein